MRAEDEAAFVTFVREVSPALLKTAWFLTGSSHAAEDLVQAALERLYVAWPRVARESAPAYARRTMVNLSTDRWRRRRREVIVADPPERVGVATDAQHVDLVRALASLPPRERQVVVLRYYADLTESSVADLLGVSLGTVKSSASRGLATLRDRLSVEEQSNATVR